MLNRDEAISELGRLRNRHVRKLLTFLGDAPEYLQSAIKRSYSMFVEDVETNIIGVDNGEKSETTNEESDSKHG